MSASLVGGLALVLFGGVFQGTFMLPMKWIQKWKWENYWLIFAFTAYLLAPWTLALITVPHLLGIYAGVKPVTWIFIGVFGAAWGAGTVLFGRGVDAIGLSLGFTIIIGIAATAGTVIPLLVTPPSHFSTVQAALTGASLVLMLIGVAICSYAGKWKDTAGSVQGHYRRGVWICVWSGLFSACGNLGFSFAAEVTRRAEGLGVSRAMAPNALWTLLTFPLFVCNLVAALAVMRRNGSRALYRSVESGRNFLYSFSMGVCWMVGMAAYGAGARKLGVLGPSLGWSMLMSSMVASANVWGVLTGEWRHAPAASFRQLAAGDAMLLAAICGLGLVNGV